MDSYTCLHAEHFGGLLFDGGRAHCGARTHGRTLPPSQARASPLVHPRCATARCRWWVSPSCTPRSTRWWASCTAAASPPSSSPTRSSPTASSRWGLCASRDCPGRVVRAQDLHLCHLPHRPHRQVSGSSLGVAQLARLHPAGGGCGACAPCHGPPGAVSSSSPTLCVGTFPTNPTILTAPCLYLRSWRP